MSPGMDLYEDSQWDLPTRRLAQDTEPPQRFAYRLTCFCGADLRLEPCDGAATTCEQCGSVARLTGEVLSQEANPNPPKVPSPWRGIGEPPA